jgi:hypothetical protein
MTNQLVHGYSFDWERVKQTWEKHFIVNAGQFDQLLSVCAVSNFFKFMLLGKINFY